MQQTCSRCGGLLAPGAATCSYCGMPVASAAYPQQNYPPPTQYGTYPQGSGATDPYAAQYNTQAAPPPPPVSVASRPYGPPSYNNAPPVQTPPFGVPQSTSFPPSQPAPQKKSSGALIGVILAIVVVLAGLGVGGYFIFGRGGAGGVNATATVGPLYQSNLIKDPGNWDCSATQCSFRSDGYHVKAPDDFVYSTLLTKTFDNFDLTVKSIITSGKTSGDSAGVGVTFRVPQSNKLEGYGFLIYADGKYGLVKWDDKGNATELISIDTASSAIHPGLNQQNTIRLVVSGTKFTLYINDQQINEVSDNTYQSGYIGLSAIDKGAEVVYSNLLINKP